MTSPHYQPHPTNQHHSICNCPSRTCILQLHKISMSVRIKVIAITYPRKSNITGLENLLKKRIVILEPIIYMVRTDRFTAPDSASYFLTLFLPIMIEMRKIHRQGFQIKSIGPVQEISIKPINLWLAVVLRNMCPLSELHAGTSLMTLF